jgi:hypothetical protein
LKGFFTARNPGDVNEEQADFCCALRQSGLGEQMTG